MSAKAITLGLWLRTAPVLRYCPSSRRVLSVPPSLVLMEFYPEGALIDLIGVAWYLGLKPELSEIYRL